MLLPSRTVLQTHLHTHLHTHTQRHKSLGRTMLTPSLSYPLHQTCVSWLGTVQVDGWWCHRGAVAMASENGWVNSPVTVMKARAAGYPRALTTWWAQPEADTWLQCGLLSCSRVSQNALLFSGWELGREKKKFIFSRILTPIRLLTCALSMKY